MLMSAIAVLWQQGLGFLPVGWHPELSTAKLGGNNQNIGAELQVGERNCCLMSVYRPWIGETPTELPTQSMHSDAGQFPDFLMVVTKVNLPNDDEDTPAFDSAAASTLPVPPKSSGEIRMDGFSWLAVSTNFYP